MLHLKIAHHFLHVRHKLMTLLLMKQVIIYFLFSSSKSTLHIYIKLQIKLCKIANFTKTGNSAKFKITDAELHVPIVTLSTKNNVNLTKQSSDGFQRSVYLNNYQTIPA